MGAGGRWWQGGVGDGDGMETGTGQGDRRGEKKERRQAGRRRKHGKGKEKAAFGCLVWPRQKGGRVEAGRQAGLGSQPNMSMCCSCM